MGPRLVLIGVLLLLVVGAMVVMSHLARWLPGEPKSDPAASEAVEGPASPDAQGEQAAPEETAQAPEAALDDAPSERVPLADAGEPGQLPDVPPPPWPRDADLPILKRYEIDWAKAHARLEDVQDHTYAFESGKGESSSAAFYYLLRLAGRLPREAFRPDPPGDEVGYEALRSMPELYRGVPVTISAVVGNVVAFAVPRPEVAGFDKFWVIDCFEPTQGDLAQVFTLVVFEDPGNPETGTRIRAKGYFYKIRDYEAKHYDPTLAANQAYIYESPMIVGRHVVVATKSGLVSDSRRDVLLLVTVGGFIVLAAMVLYLLRRLLSRREQYRVTQRAELGPAEVTERVRFLEGLQSGQRPSDASPPGGGDAEG